VKVRVAKESDRADVAETLRALPGLEGMGDSERKALAGHFELVDYDDEWVCVEGELADALYVLVSGSLEIVKRAPSGRPFVLATMAPTCLFGHVGLVTSITNRTASVRAVGKALVYRMVKLRMQVLLRSSDFEIVSPFRRALIVGLARQLQGANQSLVQLAIESGAAEPVEPLGAPEAGLDPTDAERRLLEAQSKV
jgi:CRP-like cAMP-binding protein